MLSAPSFATEKENRSPAAPRNININAANGAHVSNVGNTTKIYQGITLKEHEESLHNREKELREEFAKTSIEDKEKRELLERELGSVRNQLGNIQASYEAEIKRREEAEKRLENYKQAYPEEVVKKAQEALRNGDTDTAENLFKDSLGKAEAGAKLGAESALQLGRFAEGRVNYQAALNYYRKAVALQPGNPAHINKLGQMLLMLGQNAEATQHFQKALEIREKTAPDSAELAQSLNNLAALLHSNFDQAEQLYQRALFIFEKVYSTDHKHLTTNINDLVALFYGPGECDIPDPIFKRAHDKDEKLMEGKNDLNIAIVLNNLAELYRGQEKFAEAESLYLQALSKLESEVGNKHPYYTGALENYASFLIMAGKEKEATEEIARTVGRNIRRAAREQGAK